MENEKYNIKSRCLHWISAIIILWACLSGFYATLPTTEEHIKLTITEFNISITTVFIPIFCFRIINCLLSKKPPHPSIPTIEIKLAKMMHKALYVLISIVLVSGVLMMDRPIVLFNFFQLPQPLTDSEIIMYFNVVHKYATQLLAICVFLHIAALVRHEVIGNKILRRMI